LLISNVELRGENSPDILPYTHRKDVEKIVVPLDGYLNSVNEKLLEVLIALLQNISINSLITKIIVMA